MAHLGYALRPLRHYNPINRQAGRPLYLPPSQSGPAFLLPLLAAPAPCNGVTRFPRKLTLIGVRAGLGALASCSRTGAGPAARLGGREEVCGLAREMSTLEGSPDELDEGLRDVKEHVLPQLKQQDGFKGFIALGNRQSGELIGITFWESERVMRASEEVGDRTRRETAEDTGDTIADVKRCEVGLFEMSS